MGYVEFGVGVAEEVLRVVQEPRGPFSGTYFLLGPFVRFRHLLQAYILFRLFQAWEGLAHSRARHMP